MLEKNEMIFGVRAVIEAIQAGREIDKVLVKKDIQSELSKELFACLKNTLIPVQRVPVERINRITRKNHQGVVAFISSVTYQKTEDLVPFLFEEGKTPLFVMLDGITDVRNFGAIARTCECAGADAIIIPSKNSVSVNADAMKTSAGALHTLPVCREQNLTNTIKYLKDCGFKIVAATEKGDYDYESLYALDLEFFNKQLQDLLHGKEVELPRFNFTTGRREFKGDKLKIDDNMILILEGIHALNPELTPHIPAENKYKIYVSALTTILLDNHNYIPTTDNRLLRRIIRDYKYRGYSAEETIRRWPSVRAGEEKWIFPYQENADAMFNSALLFELAIMKDYAIPILRNVPNNKPEYSEAYRLRKFLEYFASVQDKELPPTSLLREFLGGSSFRY